MFKKIVSVSLMFSAVHVFAMQTYVSDNAKYFQSMIDFFCDAPKYHCVKDILISCLKQPDVDLSLVNSDGLRAVDIVLRNDEWSYDDRIEAIKLLVGRKAPLKYLSGQSSPLHYVAMWYADRMESSDFVMLVQYMIQHGADLNAQDGQGDTPLHIALYNKSLLCSKLFLNFGASATIKNNQGKSFLDLLAYKDAFSDSMLLYFAQRISQ